MPTAPTAPTTPSPIVRKIEAGQSIAELMRRGEIGGQALGLLQLVAAQRGPAPGADVGAGAGRN
jgi:hypothetical protein